MASQYSGNGLNYWIKDWLVAFSLLALVVTSFWAEQIPQIPRQDLTILIILWMLMVSVRGMVHYQIIPAIARKAEQGRALPLKLILAAFVLSMFITNDVALLLIIPLTLQLSVRPLSGVIISETLAANAGSALTPFGNPQNLYLFWYYDLSLGEFVKTMVPFSAMFLLLLIGVGIGLSRKVLPSTNTVSVPIEKRGWIYAGLFLLVVATVLRWLPIYLPLLMMIWIVWRDRQMLRVDYGLLLSFLFFFGVAENLKQLLGGLLQQAHHTFLLTALGSQLLGNVPAAIIISKFTDHWQAVLWGSNVGGFGSLMGSVANLIALRLFWTQAKGTAGRRFLIQFLISGYGCFLLGMLLYVLIIL